MVPEKIHHFGLVLILILSLSYSRAQMSGLSASPRQLNFQPLFDGQVDSLNLSVKNNSSFPYRLRLSIPFAEYGSLPFYLKDSVVVLEPMQTRQVWVFARVAHNVVNRGAVLVRGSSLLNPSNPGDSSNLNPINLSVPLLCQGKYRKTYYNTTQNLSEEALKQALKIRIAQNYNGLGYNTARDNMYGSLDNFNDSVTCIYTNRKAKFNSRNGASSNNFNCEHTFPQGFFNSDEPMRSDIHHLYSTDENANNSRGNLPFGTAVAPFVNNNAVNFPSSNGGGKYEPQNSHKGRCARSMMYFVLRYQDYTNFYRPQDTLLRRWHRQFPVTALDTVRNNGIFQLQNNRNPFVDYPQFERRISNFTGLSLSDSTPLLNVSNGSLVFADPDFSTLEDSLYSFMVWNTGNKSLKISSLKPQYATVSLENEQDSAFSLGKNGSRSIWIKINSVGVDTIQFQTNDSQFPVFKIPVVSILTSVNKGKNAPLKIQISPNPASNILNFYGLTIENGFEIELRDVMGRSIFQKTILPGERPQVGLPETPAGLYQVLVSQNGFSTSERLLIQR